VRVLFSFAGGRGHAEPLIPIAVAARTAGHTVAFAGADTPLRAVAALGFQVFPLGPPADTLPRRLPLLELDPAREERDLRERFVRRAARDRVPAILSLAADWQPDLVVCDEIDFGATIAAERLGIPHATVLVLAAGTLARPHVVAEPLDELRAEHGLAPDPELKMLSRFLILSPVPPSYRDPAHPLPATTHFFRTFAPEPREQPPPWLERMEAPTVLFTLGTEFNLESGDLFARVLAGLQELRIGVIVTVGSQIDPAELGPLPATVHAERYIPQSLVLPHCSAALSHGGSGSVLGALAHGLPQVLIPMGADQPLNARRCEILGVARVLDPVRCTSAEVREAVSAVLSEASYRSAAEVLKEEMATLPPLAHAVSLLERLATERRPLLR